LEVTAVLITLIALLVFALRDSDSQ